MYNKVLEREAPEAPGHSREQCRFCGKTKFPHALNGPVVPSLRHGRQAHQDQLYFGAPIRIVRERRVL